jgi:hypothetical protein
MLASRSTLSVRSIKLRSKTGRGGMAKILLVQALMLHIIAFNAGQDNGQRCDSPSLNLNFIVSYNFVAQFFS